MKNVKIVWNTIPPNTSLSPLTLLLFCGVVTGRNVFIANIKNWKISKTECAVLSRDPKLHHSCQRDWFFSSCQIGLMLCCTSVKGLTEARLCGNKTDQYVSTDFQNIRSLNERDYLNAEYEQNKMTSSAYGRVKTKEDIGEKPNWHVILFFVFNQKNCSKQLLLHIKPMSQCSEIMCVFVQPNFSLKGNFCLDIEEFCLKHIVLKVRCQHTTTCR